METSSGPSATAAEERHRHLKLAGLPADKRRLGVVAGDEDALDIGGLYRRQLGVEVLVALGEFLLDRDFAAVRR